jgi:hypothetical protein
MRQLEALESVRDPRTPLVWLPGAPRLLKSERRGGRLRCGVFGSVNERLRAAERSDGGSLPPVACSLMGAVQAHHHELSRDASQQGISALSRARAERHLLWACRPLQLGRCVVVGGLPVASYTPVLVEQPGVLATLSRWRSWVQIPPGTLMI